MVKVFIEPIHVCTLNFYNFSLVCMHTGLFNICAVRRIRENLTYITFLR